MTAPSAGNLLPYVIPAALAGIGGIAYTAFSPSNQLWGPVLHHAPAGTGSQYALSFDDGPTDGGTNAVLDILGDCGVKAAFFVIGSNIRRYPALLRRIHAEGHLVGNHTYNHPRYGVFRGPIYWNREIISTDQIIEETIGVRPAMFRPPLGIKMLHIARAARHTRHAMVTWSRRAYDGVPTTCDRILSRLAPTTRPGDILALHDGIEPNRPRSANATIAALRPLIETLAGRGLMAARLDELLGIPAYAPAGALARV